MSPRKKVGQKGGLERLLRTIEKDPSLQTDEYRLLLADAIEENARRNELIVEQATTISELSTEVERLSDMSITDDLTGLYNQRYYHSELLKTIENAKREASRGHYQAVGVIMFDIDYFKKVNDIFGHPVGDEILKQVAEEVKASVRKVDIACRIGGEEFAIIFSESCGPDTDEATIEKNMYGFAERIRTRVFENVEIDADENLLAKRRKVHPDYKDRYNRLISISMGIRAKVYGQTEDSEIGHYMQQGSIKEEAETLHSEADEALYHSKDHGRNMVSMYSKPNTLVIQNARPRKIEEAPKLLIDDTTQETVSPEAKAFSLGLSVYEKIIPASVRNAARKLFEA